MRTVAAGMISWTLLHATSMFAQNDSFTVKVDVPVVSIDVVVTDSNDDLVNNFRKSDFEIYEDGVPQDIRYFSPVSAPYNVFLLFDRSVSTSEHWLFMRDAVVRFIENLRDQDRFALGSFAGDYDIELTWGNNASKVSIAL